jgi:uncharacterized protein (DUF362 family)
MKVFLSNEVPYLDFIDIVPEQWVVIKPNLIKEFKGTDPFQWESVITSPLLIKQVAEYVCKQLHGTGKITICDAPQTDSSFEKIVEEMGLNEIAKELISKYGTLIEIVDLRNEEWTNEGGVITKRKKLVGDPNGVIAFNLGRKSLFYQHSSEGRFYGADYDYKTLNKHHTGDIQEYLVCATPILADVFICLPKLKTHKKTGVTLSLKNLVGINADKNWLPHHAFGSPIQKGDEYPDITFKRKIETFGSKALKKFAVVIPSLVPIFARFIRNAGIGIFGKESDTIRSGNWYGNNTTWRMVIDLNRCLLYGNEDGTFRDSNPKKYYSIVDGEIGMEGAGPTQGTPKKCGIFIGGTDPVAVDSVASTMMGFDWEKIPLIRESFYLQVFPITQCKPDQIIIESEVSEWNGTLENLQKHKHFDFEPHFGWKNHIELANHES